MDFLTRLRIWLAPTVVRAPPVPYVLTVPSITGLSATANTESYLKAYGEIGWLFACVSRISSAVADTEWQLWQGRGQRRQQVDAHPLLDLLNGANPFMTGQELWEYTQMWMDLAGEAFWIVNQTRLGVPAEIWPVPPSRMSVLTDAGKFLTGYRYIYGAVVETFKPDEVIHFRYPRPWDLYRGMGVVQPLAVDLDTEANAAKWNRNFFANSARPDGVLESPNGLTKDQFDRLREQWRRGHQGVDNAHRVAVLESGLSYKQISLSPQDVAFVEGRKLTRDNIIGAFGVPLSILGITESVNRANAETGEYTFARWVVRPRVRRLARKLNETLVPLFGPDLELDFVDPTPANREAARLDAESGMKAGYLLVDEARDLMGLSPLPNQAGQVLLLPLTLVPTAPTALNVAPPAGSSALPPKADGGQPKALARSQLSEAAKDALGELFVKRAAAREGAIRALMLAYFAGQQDRVAAALSTTKAAGDDIDWPAEQQRLADDARPLVVSVLAEAGQQAADDYGLGISFDLANPLVQRWLGERMRQFSRTVTDTTREAVTEELRAAAAAGESIDQMAARIRQYYATHQQWRAEVAARTETIYASNQGAIESYKQAGLSEWEWLATQDERLCELCAPLHGTRHPVNENFEPPHPQCRCTALAVIGE